SPLINNTSSSSCAYRSGNCSLTNQQQRYNEQPLVCTIPSAVTHNDVTDLLITAQCMKPIISIRNKRNFMPYQQAQNSFTQVTPTTSTISISRNSKSRLYQEKKGEKYN
ncbi:unnamed protein product, partial [Didymodactylos carnosus]